MGYPAVSLKDFLKNKKMSVSEIDKKTIQSLFPA